ncbi:MAG: ABC transporter permease [Crocinitomicaceae bacterium]|nr:ABC transporter permease [Crocinitomicaceae bacterium]
MNKIWLIIKREYLSRVRKKSFIVMTFLGPLLFAGLMFGAIALTLNDATEYDVLIADPNGLITEYSENGHHLVPRFPERFNKNSDHLRYAFTKEVQSIEEFKKGLYNVMIELDDQSINNGQCNFIFKKFPADDIRSEIRSDLQESLERFRVTDNLKLDYETYKRARINVSFVEKNVDKMGEKDMTQAKAVIGFGFAILIYMFIFLYGVQVMRGVIEEKTNRIVEVIVSSVKPFQLMMGKVIGIGMVGLTQFLMWIALSAAVAVVGMLFFQSKVAGGAAVIENAQVISVGVGQAESMKDLMNNEAINWFFEINWPLMIFLFVFYFIGGYMLYGSMFAAIGAAVDSDADTQQFMMPITLPLIFGYIVSAMMITNPESAAGNFFAVFPLTSPITMMVKASIGTQIGLTLLSMLMLVLAFVFFIWVAGRIYRIGILMYGKKATYPELWKWMWYKG